MYTLRVSLIPQDRDLFSREHLIRDIKLFEKALLHAGTTQPSLEQSTEDDRYSVKVLVNPDENGVMGGIVSKGKKLHGHDAEFNEYDIDDFPPLIWMWDLSEQVILIEKKASVFSSASIAAKAFQQITNNSVLNEASLRAEIEPVLDDNKNDFWAQYDSFELVERIELELIPPNLFGDTEKSMKDALNDVSNQTNANKMKTILENSEGRLKLSSDGWVGNAIRWIKKGGGNWTLWGKNSKETKSTKKTSNKSAKIVIIKGELTEVQLKSYDTTELLHFIKHFRPEYTYKDNHDD